VIPSSAWPLKLEELLHYAGAGDVVLYLRKDVIVCVKSSDNVISISSPWQRDASFDHGQDRSHNVGIRVSWSPVTNEHDW
jgi:hypothetical protein